MDEKDYLPVLFYREFYSLFKERDDFRKLVDMYLTQDMTLRTRDAARTTRSS